MKYMLLVYGSEDAWTEAERQECFMESTQLTHDLLAKGQYLGASPLQSIATATSVGVRDGRRIVTDGPFAETREQLGGYFLVDAADLDEAIAIAERIPGARKGTVEVRPVVALPDLPAGSFHESSITKRNA
ncbi:MAG: YciI family protein [Thermoanaerobaculia bacterium]